jgi:hypothetical protein
MKGNLVNVSAKGSSTVMVLAVYVVCDCPAHGDETCSRRDGEKPSFGKKYVDQLAESNTTLATDYSRGFVESQNPVQAMTLNQAAACVEARIAVTPALAKRKQGARLGGVEDLGYLVIPSRFVYLGMLDPWIAAPGKNTFGAKRGWRALAFGQACG